MGTSTGRELLFTGGLRGGTAATVLGKRLRALLPAAGGTTPSVLLGKLRRNLAKNVSAPMVLHFRSWPVPYPHQA